MRPGVSSAGGSVTSLIGVYCNQIWDETTMQSGVKYTHPRLRLERLHAPLRYLAARIVSFLKIDMRDRANTIVKPVTNSALRGRTLGTPNPATLSFA